MKKIILLLTALFSLVFNSQAQCDSVNIGSNYSISADIIMGGTYVINGTFTLQAGATIFVTPYTTNNCGSLRIYANKIVILGTINGDYAGFPGGAGGAKGLLVTSTTGDELSLTSCNDPDNTGDILVESGFSGLVGAGLGAGLQGANGTNGGGTKQYCGNTQDDAGLVGSPGGAGGGAGGSYGGLGSNGGSGGAGTNQVTATDLPISNVASAFGGVGGIGGLSSSTYGTSNLRDIELGSGGAGAGGGGLSFSIGTNGGNGGNGGGMVFLKANTELEVAGIVTVKGANGGNGGNGGNGDATADCCSDGCNGCDERTFSAGAGAGAGAGGGSGGGIFLESLGIMDISGSLVSTGGNGGSGGNKGTGASCDYDGGFFCGTQSIVVGDGTNGQAGGAGSGGRIKIFTATCTDATITGIIDVTGGTGFVNAENGTLEEVCGFAGLAQGDLSIGWNIYPNPTSDVLNVDILSGTNENNHLVIVIDAMGRTVIQKEMEGISTTLKTSELPSGIYSVKITNSKSTEVKRFVKK